MELGDAWDFGALDQRAAMRWSTWRRVRSGDDLRRVRGRGVTCFHGVAASEGLFAALACRAELRPRGAQSRAAAADGRSLRRSSAAVAMTTTSRRRRRACGPALRRADSRTPSSVAPWKEPVWGPIRSTRGFTDGTEEGLRLSTASSRREVQPARGHRPGLQY